MGGGGAPVSTCVIFQEPRDLEKMAWREETGAHPPTHHEQNQSPIFKAREYLQNTGLSLGMPYHLVVPSLISLGWTNLRCNSQSGHLWNGAVASFSPNLACGCRGTFGGGGWDQHLERELIVDVMSFLPDLLYTIQSTFWSYQLSSAALWLLDVNWVCI